MTAICIIIFVILTYWLWKLTVSSSVSFHLPYGEHLPVWLTGREALVIAMCATAWIGLSPVLAIRLGVLEVLALIALFRSPNKAIFSFPLKLYCIFIAWVIIGIFYTPDIEFGVRMLLKYIYPIIIALFASAVVRDGDVFWSSGIWARRIASIGVICIFFAGKITGAILWYAAPFITGLIAMVIFSFALYLFGPEYAKRKNLWWGILLCLPCLIAVFRTDIFGTCVGIATLFFIKYRLKSLPLLLGMGMLGLCVMFYVPAVKNKMFKDPHLITMENFVTGNTPDDAIETNKREYMWRDAKGYFYINHETIGSGTGRVQKYFYTEIQDDTKNGQLHNDFLVIMCDNGNIGLALFLLTYASALLHCMRLYRRSEDEDVRMCALVSGASMIGIMVTMYSDNTLSYSMVTLFFPWVFYGMTLGLDQKAKCE